MTAFTLGAIAGLRLMLSQKRRVDEICAIMDTYTRDQIVEAIDAIHRNPSNEQALAHVNTVLRYQAEGVAMVNGHPWR